jgi:hypothetical protein
MSQYKFVVGFILGLLLGLVPPLVMIRMDSDKLNELSAKISAREELSRSAAPAPVSPSAPAGTSPAPSASAVRTIQAHDITAIQEAWKSVVLPAGGLVVYVGPAKGVHESLAPGGDDRVVVLYQGTVEEQKAVADAIAAAARPAPPAAP